MPGIHFQNLSRSHNNHYYYYGKQHQIRPNECLCTIQAMLLRASKWTVTFQGNLAELQGLVHEASEGFSHVMPHCNIFKYLGLLTKGY